MEMTSAPSLAPLLADENSIDLEDVRDDLRTELIVLNGDLKKIDKD